MPKAAQPRYDATRRQWFIRKNYRKFFLCTGTKFDWIKAAKAAEGILGHPVAVEGTPKCIANAVEQWLLRNESDWNRSMLHPFLRFAGQIEFAAVNEDLLADYHAYLKRVGYTRTYQKKGEAPRSRKFKYSAKSLVSMIGMASSVLKWAAEPPRRWINVIPRRPNKMEKPRIVYRDIPRDLLREAFGSFKGRSARAGALCRFILSVGCRPEEACLLERDKINWESRFALVKDHKTKKSTGQDRIIYLTPEAIEILKNQPNKDSKYVFLNRWGKPYKSTSIRSFMIRRGINRAYDLRHTYAQHARESGIPLDVLQKQLGHKHISTTQIYAQIRDLQAQEAADNLASPLQHLPLSLTDPETSSSLSPESQAVHESTQQKQSKGRVRRSA